MFFLGNWGALGLVPPLYFTTLGDPILLILFNEITTGHVTGRFNSVTASEAWLMDSKTDDGKPAHGNFIVPSLNLNGNNCTTSTDINLTQYNLSYSDKACTPHFITRIN